MPTTITASKAVEKGTYIISASFIDENGDAVTPDTLSWSLVNYNGAVINSRLNIPISSPSANQDFVLSGDDLAIDSGYDEQKRWLYIEGTYTSDAGSDLSLKDEVCFTIVNLKGVK